MLPTRTNDAPSWKTNTAPLSSTVTRDPSTAVLNPNGPASSGAATALEPRSIVTGTVVSPRGVTITTACGGTSVAATQTAASAIIRGVPRPGPRAPARAPPPGVSS